MRPYRVVLADDHTMFRQGVTKILEERIDIEVIGTADNGTSLLELLKTRKPDMVILNLTTPDLGCFDVIHDIKSLNPKIKVLVLNMHNDEEYLLCAISAGGDGYLLKQDADTDLFSAIDSIRQGNYYISPKLTQGLIDNFVEMCRQTYRVNSCHLSIREREILKLIADGKTSKDIAKILFISPRTVDNHRTKIMEKLRLRTIPALVKYAIIKEYISRN